METPVAPSKLHPQEVSADCVERSFWEDSALPSCISKRWSQGSYTHVAFTGVGPPLGGQALCWPLISIGEWRILWPYKA